MRDIISFKDWLLTETAQSRLAIFDFDGTLSKSPTKPEGWGKDWRQQGLNKKPDWWRHEASLSPPLYDYSMYEDVLRAFKQARQDPNTRAVILTGREGEGAAHLVRNVLRQHDLHGRRVIHPDQEAALASHTDEHPKEFHPHSHEEYYKGDHKTEPDYPKTKRGKPSGDTLDHKLYQIKKLVNDDTVHVEFWEDRDEHIPHFADLFRELLKEKPNLQGAVIYHHKDGQIKKIPLIKGNIPR